MEYFATLQSSDQAGQTNTGQSLVRQQADEGKPQTAEITETGSKKTRLKATMFATVPLIIIISMLLGLMPLERIILERLRIPIIDYSLARLAERNLDRLRALQAYQRAADQGYLDAQFKLGYLYYITNMGDYVEAARWYRKAADQGHVDAQYYLGQLYYKGQGVPADITEAARWYRKVADQGNEWAQNKLREMSAKERR
jgi:TPR repeat protein